MNSNSFRKSAILVVLSAFLIYPVRTTDAQVPKGELVLGKKVTDTIKPGEKHSYKITLRKNRFAFFKLLQEGVDIMLTSYDPGSKKIQDFDSPNGTQGMEYALIFSDTNGKYVLELSALGNSGPEGKYQLEFVSSEVAAKTPAGKVDQIFRPWQNPDTPGAAVAVVKDGTIAYSKGYGMANLEYDVPVKPDTVFHIASVSKQFTTFSILLLEKDGKLSLDDDVRKYIPEVPDFGKKITLRHLAHHTSGLRDQWNLLALAGWRLDDVITKEHILNLVSRQNALNFDPGAEYSYSNTGFTLLAEVVARVSGKTFPDFTEEQIFKPLGMKNTLFYDDHERIVKNRAYSYRPSGAGFKKSVLSYANVGATSLFTTVEDLSLWAMNFENPTVGDQAIFEKMKTRGVLNNGRKINYALGQVIGKYRGLNQISHGGGDAGYRTFLSRFPDQKYSVIVFSNDGAFNSGLMAAKVADVYLKGLFIDKPKTAEAKAPAKAPAEAVKLDAKTLESYAGQYELAPSFIITITAKSGELFGKATGQPELRLRALALDKFAVEGVEAEVSFHKDGEGKVNLLKLNQGGRIQNARRIKPFDPKAVKLDDFTGDFYSEELATTYSFVVEDGKLVAKHIRHPDTDLRPVKKDRFLSGAWYMPDIEFVRDSNGSISGLKISSGRVRNVRFRKTQN